jgi:hypothetical protein
MDFNSLIRTKFLCIEITRIRFLVIAMPLFILSCSEDNDDTKNIEKGALVIDGIEYALTGGNIQYEGQISDSVGHIFGIYLHTSGLDLETLKGTGHLVILQMITETDDVVKNGIYSKDMMSGEIGWFQGFIIMDFDIENPGTSSVSYQVTSGTINIDKSEEVYELNLDAIAQEYGHNRDVNSENVKINCSYKGNLMQVSFIDL